MDDDACHLPLTTSKLFHLVTAGCQRMTAEEIGVDIVHGSVVDDVLNRREGDVSTAARGLPWRQLQTQRAIRAGDEYSSTVIA